VYGDPFCYGYVVNHPNHRHMVTFFFVMVIGVSHHEPLVDTIGSLYIYIYIYIYSFFIWGL